MQVEIQNVPNSLLKDIIDEWVKGEKNRQILKDRHIELLTIEQLAEKYEYSPTTIKKIFKKYNPLIFKQADKLLNQKVSENCLICRYYFSKI